MPYAITDCVSASQHVPLTPCITIAGEERWLHVIWPLRNNQPETMGRVI